MDADQLLDVLRAGQSSLQDVGAPSRSGVYAFYLNEDRALPTVSDAGDRPIYLGLSSNLAERQYATHFEAGKSGFSTLRRSLGALLREELNLAPRPRGTGASDTNYRCYRFDDSGEQRLSKWMQEHLHVAVQAVADPKELEAQLIALACPPLNLTLWRNPDAPAIKAARKACVEAARAERR